jgi:hypothetical protein
MLRRLEVHEKLVAAVGPGIPVIFRPTQKHTLEYPCVVYDISGYPKTSASGSTYVIGEEYEVKYLSNRPGDSRAVNLLKLAGASHLRTFINDDIVHDIFRISHMSQ